MSLYTIHSDYKAGNVNTEKKTTKNEKYVTNISDPNTLDDFASYTSLFTLSGLTKEEITRPNLLNNPPHDIILRSGGIGNADNSNGCWHRTGISTSRMFQWTPFLP